METGSAATTAPRTKRKSPAPRSTDGKPSVKTTKVVTLEATTVQHDSKGNVFISTLGVEQSSAEMTLAPKHAEQVLACLRALLGGRGTGTPRKK